MCIHIFDGGRQINYRTIIYKHKVMLRVQPNAKVVGHTKLAKTQRMIGLLWAVLK
jgi:hypothetical protein